MTNAQPVRSIAVLTSGGDASGMNAAVRAVVRTALHHHLDVHAVFEGYKGLVAGGDLVAPMGSREVGGILQRGGSVIGSARSDEFRTRDGRRRATANLLERGIDALVVVGGDGSLTGAEIFRREWSDLAAELVESGDIEAAVAARHPQLRVVGLVGSIDNDMFGTDMTIGADTALHRIADAIDAIHSTAASHQRSFVIEVMGRHCGYLALMSALATGANWVFIPENPPDVDDWRDSLAESLKAGRRMGRRQNLVIVAEGAQDRDGEPITSEMVKEVLETHLGEDTRITVLGHVQRGGSPSPFDRYLGTVLGFAAVQCLVEGAADDEPQVIGIREHEVVSSPLVECVERTREVAEAIAAQDYAAAMRLRGGSFTESFRTLRTLTRSLPRTTTTDHEPLRLAVLHAGGPAPGMNTAVRVAVRLGLDRGHTMLGVRNGFAGLRDGAVRELEWMSVSEWVWRGGAELGVGRFLPDEEALERIAAQISEHRIDGLLMVGGWAGYVAAHRLSVAREHVPALDIPIVCLPATINNDLPGSELSIGADTALGSIVGDVDKIKQSAVAAGRCFVVEVMGHDCGYLPLMGGLASGAERVYLPEEGITLDDLQADVRSLTAGFAAGKRLGLVIRGEHADTIYTAAFIHALFEKEGGDLFDVRQAILGHVQQGGDPSPFDRIQATRLTARGLDHLIDQASRPQPSSAMIGLQAGKVRFTELSRFPELVEPGLQRPVEQSWLSLRPIARIMSGQEQATDDGGH